MTKATKHTDRPHARIYHHWMALPAWKAMRNEAQLLLVYMLAEFRPSLNSRLEWTLTRVQEVLRCSRSTASDCLTDLEKNGWIKVCRVGLFSGSRKPSLYRLTMYRSEVEALAATEEFLRVRNPPRPGRKKNLSGSNKALHKSLSKPEQVPVETAMAENGSRGMDPQPDIQAKKINVLRPRETFRPEGDETRESQLLAEAGVVPPCPRTIAGSGIDEPSPREFRSPRKVH